MILCEMCSTKEISIIFGTFCRKEKFGKVCLELESWWSPSQEYIDYSHGLGDVYLELKWFLLVVQRIWRAFPKRAQACPKLLACVVKANFHVCLSSALLE